VRNVRAAIFFVLSGGNPVVLKPVLERPRTPHIERRALRGALAYGEGRVVDALGLLSKLEARKLDPLLGGIVALIQGTLASRKEPTKAIAFFDEARLLSPGTLIEEAALRQQILLLAREGELERFDLLAAQYSRRFPNSLFARSFRRQFFAGVARQNFKRASEWISRTETELMKVPAAERVGLYLAIAEEATKGGNLDIARFAAGKARELSRADSRSFQRAALFEGAALAATPDFGQGIDMLNKVDPTQLGISDREIRDSALAIAGAVGRWPAPPEKLEEPEPEAVTRAQALLAKVDSLLGGSSP
jgi:chemotaxis protein MotC